SATESCSCASQREKPSSGKAAAFNLGGEAAAAAPQERCHVPGSGECRGSGFGVRGCLIGWKTRSATYAVDRIPKRGLPLCTREHVGRHLGPMGRMGPPVVG